MQSKNVSLCAIVVIAGLTLVAGSVLPQVSASEPSVGQPLETRRQGVFSMDGGNLFAVTVSTYDGKLIQEAGSVAMYLVREGQRHLVPDIGTRDAMRYSPATIKVLDSTTFGSIPEGYAFFAEGALIRASGTLDVWIVKYAGEKQFKRLILNPSVFESYGHLRWEDVLDVSQSAVDAFPVADLVRVAGSTQVYKLIAQGDTGVRQPISDSAISQLGLDAESIYVVNPVDRDSYAEGAPIEYEELPPSPPLPTTLTLVKTVVNDEGGTMAVNDFILFVDQTQVTSGVPLTISPGTYTATETSLSGYTASAWGGDCASDGTVTVADGEEKTCTITNNDDAPPPSPSSPLPTTLTLVKTVVNDEGGTMAVNDFILFIDQNRVTSGVPLTISPGTYTAREGHLTGYVASAWGGDCASDGTVTVADGEEKTCTITNNDDPSLPPPETLICNATKTVAVGETLTFRVTSSDPNPSNIVSLNVVGLPIGAVMTPQLPISGNPASSDFSWTPITADIGLSLVLFSATILTTALCPVTITITA